MDRQDWDADDENNIEDETQDFTFYGRDSVIFLIDSTKPMFKKDANGTSPFRISLECCKTTMMNKIISSEKDLIGVIFFGTDKKDNKLNVPHITVLQDVLQPSAEKIKQLENLLKVSDDDFESQFGHSDDFNISDALWLCQTLFSTSQVKTGSKRILLFTNNDNPHSGSPNKQHQARIKAKDLGQTEIDLELLHIGSSFNSEIFYKEIIQFVKGDDTDDWRIPNPANRFEELMARVCRKDHKKRSMGNLHFELGDGVKLGITVYNLVRPTYFSARVILDKNTNEEVKSTIKKFDAETGDGVLTTEISKYLECAHRKITVAPDEIISLRKMQSPGLKLLGFKPASKIKDHHVSPSSFIYPEERLIQGSCKLFGALLERCVTRNVVPICCFTARSNACPAIVALVPQQEVMDDSNMQVVPPGFHLVYLPYAEDIRKLDIESSVKADPEQTQKAKEVIRKLRFRYSPYMFENPSLQTQWSNIEALALNHKHPREVIDTTVPDHENMKEKLGNLSQEFLDMVYPPGYVPGDKPKKAPRGKRSLDVTNEKTRKVVKTENIDVDMRELAEHGKVEKLKVDELKKYLTEQGYQVKSMKKTQLVAKVYQHLGVSEPN
ncbi:hypothetical protein L9F63_008992 [Diploptera punctata]|uniref:ATP-dependent DNA helicase 2 subunit 1 n=1 Tax=Diploptera punctata TaxID=6984 RepID=A0AAD7Z4C2_DIPPU|nr:hypothetical protein L9F63_008992 [Diploptera punctata]